MNVLAYGEDPLTLKALSSQTDYFLREMKDSSQPEKSLLIYRPSFGRGRGGAFGEFDAILASPEAVYLIEAKWDQSSEFHKKANRITLREPQLHRHRTMRLLLESHRISKCKEWNQIKSTAMSLAEQLPVPQDLLLPDSDSLLASNFLTMAGVLGSYGSEIVDVLLFLSQERTAPTPRLENASTFRCVRMLYQNAVGNFYSMVHNG